MFIRERPITKHFHFQGYWKIITSVRRIIKQLNISIFRGIGKSSLLFVDKNEYVFADEQPDTSKVRNIIAKQVNPICYARYIESSKYNCQTGKSYLLHILSLITEIFSLFSPHPYHYLCKKLNLHGSN